MKCRSLLGVLVGVAGLVWSSPALADDIVHLANGGRLRGTIIEQDPARGVTIQLPDRSFRYLAPDDVKSVEYGTAAASPPVPVPPGSTAPAPETAPTPPPQPEGAMPPAPPALDAAPPLPPVYALPPSQVYAPPPVYAPPSPPPSPPPPVSSPPPATASSAPDVPARHGFQMSIRLGGASPHGNITRTQYSGESGRPLRLDRRVRSQMMLQIDLGWRSSPHWYWGAYLSVAGGAPGTEPRESCDAANLECRAQTNRFGALVQYHHFPDRRWDPWVEYGLGVQTVLWNDAGAEGRIIRSYSGLEWGVIGLGIDWRPSPTYGLGVFVRESLSTFSEMRVQTETADRKTSIKDGDQTVHGWFMFGIRGILYP